MELGRAGGVEQATYELIAALARLDRKNAYRVLAPRAACWEWDFPREFSAERIPSGGDEQAAMRFHGFVARRLGAGPVPRDEEAAFGFDLVHSTCSYINPELTEFPGILTIQDLQHLHHPEFFTRSDWEERERLYRASAQRARRVICGSEFTRQDVHQRYGIPLEKLTTVWNIPSSTAWRTIPPNRCRALLGAMGVHGPFLLYPAHSWPHKNHARLVQAIEMADRELPAEIQVVLTGNPFPPDHPAAAMLRRHSRQSRIVHLGYRSPLEFRALLQSCTALVFPSLFEGFGMPVAEALIAGKPVACSNVTSLPEIAGGAAVTFDPTDAVDMAKRIVEVATNEELRQSLVQAASRRRTAFSAWSCAVRTLAVYESVFSELAP